MSPSYFGWQASFLSFPSNRIRVVLPFDISDDRESILTLLAARFSHHFRERAVTTETELSVGSPLFEFILGMISSVHQQKRANRVRSTFYRPPNVQFYTDTKCLNFTSKVVTVDCLRNDWLTTRPVMLVSLILVIYMRKVRTVGTWLPQFCPVRLVPRRNINANSGKEPKMLHSAYFFFFFRLLASRFCWQHRVWVD